MADRITVTLHHLVSMMDGYADAVLQARYGVTFNLFQFVSAVGEYEPVDITTLARCLFVSKAAVSKRVPGLVADGWIAASDDPHHGRRVLLTLTPRGRELVAQAGGMLDRDFTDLVSDPDLRAAGIDVARLNDQLESLIAFLSTTEIPS